ncbi:MAG: pyrroline-5-carboxylate reductase [Legionellaceae bacterium]|nr:pyrroline-5-carboxylate reductase [Legionellaceae bacterium]
MKICFIGFGNMAKAIAKGLTLQRDLDIYACSPSLPEGKNPWGISTHYDNNSGAEGADVIILAVKPPQILPVIAALNPQPEALFISVAAAIPLQKISDALPHQAVVRAMPNTPIAVGYGATPLTANSHCQAQHIKAAERIFSDSGISAWVEERELEALSPLSGSGPAYVFLFLEALIEAAIALGLSESISQRFAKQTLAGALALCENSPEAIADLRRQVTSAGGTTAAALAVFEHEHFNGMVTRALQAAQHRAQQLREELL